MQKHPLETSSSGSVSQNRRLGILIEDFLSFVPPFLLLEKKSWDVKQSLALDSCPFVHWGLKISYLLPICLWTARM